MRHRRLKGQGLSTIIFDIQDGHGSASDTPFTITNRFPIRDTTNMFKKYT